MVSVDQLVDQIYEDRLIKQDLHGFVTRVPEIPWVTTPAIYEVEFSTTGAPIIAQIGTIKDPTA
jgi:hypothetical protein